MDSDRLTDSPETHKPNLDAFLASQFKDPLSPEAEEARRLIESYLHFKPAETQPEQVDDIAQPNQDQGEAGVHQEAPSMDEFVTLIGSLKDTAPEDLQAVYDQILDKIRELPHTVDDQLGLFLRSQSIPVEYNSDGTLNTDALTETFIHEWTQKATELSGQYNLLVSRIGINISVSELPLEGKMSVQPAEAQRLLRALQIIPDGTSLEDFMRDLQVKARQRGINTMDQLGESFDLEDENGDILYSCVTSVHGDTSSAVYTFSPKDHLLPEGFVIKLHMGSRREGPMKITNVEIRPGLVPSRDALVEYAEERTAFKKAEVEALIRQYPPKEKPVPEQA